MEFLGWFLVLFERTTDLYLLGCMNSKMYITCITFTTSGFFLPIYEFYLILYQQTLT